MKSVWRIIESDNLGRADNGAVDVGPNHTIPYYYVGPNRPLFAELLPCALSTTCSALSLVNRLLGMPGLRPSRWWWQEVFKRKYSIVHIMSENGLNMIDLVLTHLNQPWGPPWTLATLGDMLENDHFGGNWSFSSMLQRVAKVQGGPQGWLRWVRTKSIIFKPFFNMTCTV